MNDNNYQLRIPVNVDVFIAKDDCVRLIIQFVEEMDLTVYRTYERLPAKKYATPTMMLKITRQPYQKRRYVG